MALPAVVLRPQESGPGVEAASEGYGNGVVSVASLAGACAGAQQECLAQAGYGYPEQDDPARR
jgi:hypothetical protein